MCDHVPTRDIPKPSCLILVVLAPLSVGGRSSLGHGQVYTTNECLHVNGQILPLMDLATRDCIANGWQCTIVTVHAGSDRYFPHCPPIILVESKGLVNLGLKICGNLQECPSMVKNTIRYICNTRLNGRRGLLHHSNELRHWKHYHGIVQQKIVA